MPKLPQSHPTYAPDWRKWRAYAQVTLAEAVALSCGIEPECVAWFTKMRLGERTGDLSASDIWSQPLEVSASAIPEGLMDELGKRLDIAANHVQAGKLQTTHRSLNGSLELVVFARWAKGVGVDLPSEFLRAAPSTEKPERQWPWGTYETPLLIKLAEAGREFFATPSSKPHQKKVVTAWLREHGVETERVAQFMAQILCG